MNRLQVRVEFDFVVDKYLKDEEEDHTIDQIEAWARKSRNFLDKKYCGMKVTKRVLIVDEGDMR